VRRSIAEEQQLFVYKADFYTIPRDPAIIVAINILINPDANFKRILRSTNAVFFISLKASNMHDLPLHLLSVQFEPTPYSKNVLLCCIVRAILTYLLTPWSRSFLEKLTGSQLVKKFPAFYGTRRLITANPEPDQSSPCPIPLPKDPS
jgi:hypothetical protein